MAKLGYLQKQMFDYLVKHPGQHYVNPSSEDIRIARSLEKRGLIHLTDCGMCTASGKTCYMAQAITENVNV